MRIKTGVVIVARVTLTLANGLKPWRLVHTGSSYCSQSDLALTFLGDQQRAEAIEAIWPTGQMDRIVPTVASQVVTVQEGKGVISMGLLPTRGQPVWVAARPPDPTDSIRPA